MVCAYLWSRATIAKALGVLLAEMRHFTGARLRMLSNDILLMTRGMGFWWFRLIYLCTIEPVVVVAIGFLQIISLGGKSNSLLLLRYILASIEKAERSSSPRVSSMLLQRLFVQFFSSQLFGCASLSCIVQPFLFPESSVVLFLVVNVLDTACCDAIECVKARNRVVSEANGLLTMGPRCCCCCCWLCCCCCCCCGCCCCNCCCCCCR